MQATTSAHLDQNKGSLQEGHFNGTLSSVVGKIKPHTQLVHVSLLLTMRQVEVDDHPEKK